MNNAAVAIALEQLAGLLEFQSANPFRVRAYRNAAELIENLPEQVAAIVTDPNRKLTDISGIGADLAEKITTLVTTGRLPLLDELSAQVSPGALKLLRVPGLGPKKAATLIKELGVQSPEELLLACHQHRVQKVKGFSAKSEASIVAGLAMVMSPDAQRFYWAEVDATAAPLRSYLSDAPAIAQFELVGSYRRGRETVGNLDIVATPTVDDPAGRMAALEALTNYPPVAEVLERSETSIAVALGSGLRVDLRLVEAPLFGEAVQQYTGSAEHNAQLAAVALKKKSKFDPAGLSEAELYASLDLPPFPPELREGRFEFAWADAGPLPRLIELGDLRGDLHMHTTASDGGATLLEMIQAAKALGLSYIAITDHSKRVSMANGLNSERLLRQWAEIDEVNSQLSDFRVLKGVEVDILERGGLDIDDETLAQADWVNASVHYGQNQSIDQITTRIVDAIADPNVTAISHPTGRLLNRRKPYEVDMEAVLEAAAKYGKCLELNANPARLDLHDIHLAAAKRRGIPIVISSDAHSTDGLEKLRYGIVQARRGGLTRDDVINTRSWQEVLAFSARCKAGKTDND